LNNAIPLARPVDFFNEIGPLRTFGLRQMQHRTIPKVTLPGATSRGGISRKAVADAVFGQRQNPFGSSRTDSAPRSKVDLHSNRLST
jgi:hypothetical protein